MRDDAAAAPPRGLIGMRWGGIGGGLGEGGGDWR